MIRLHLRLVRNGWSIPNSLEWLFWPIGYQDNVTAESRTFTAPEGSTVKFDGTLSGITYRSLAGRFKLVDREKFTAQLVRLGAIKEQKP